MRLPQFAVLILLAAQTFLPASPARADEDSQFVQKKLPGATELERRMGTQVYRAIRALVVASANEQNCWPAPSLDVKARYLEYVDVADQLDKLMLMRSRTAGATPKNAEIAFQIQDLAMIARTIVGDLLGKQRCYDIALQQYNKLLYYTPISNEKRLEISLKIENLNTRRSMQ